MDFPVETLPVRAIVAWGRLAAPGRVGQKRDVSFLAAVQHPQLILFLLDLLGGPRLQSPIGPAQWPSGLAQLHLIWRATFFPCLVGYVSPARHIRCYPFCAQQTTRERTRQ
jgi:hypothetical protein